MDTTRFFELLRSFTQLTLQNYLAWFRVCNQEPNNAKSWLSGEVKILTNM